ncbi:MAG: hypothetical protein ACPGWR_25065 [Ardenticatenaceae bacterium]
MKIKPFQRVNRFTWLDNYFWDHFMPSVPPSAWRIFCYLYRQTVGWDKGETALTPAQIQSGCGCRSPKTVKKMIKLLQKRGVIIAKPGNRYALNTNFEFEAKITAKNTAKKPQSVKNTAKNTAKKPESIKNAVKNTEKKEGLHPFGEKKRLLAPPKERKQSDLRLIQSLTQTLTEINNQLPPTNTPLSRLPILAKQLARRGETAQSTQTAWQACQKEARNPLGAFLVWCRDHYLPMAPQRRPAKPADSPPAPTPHPQPNTRE